MQNTEKNSAVKIENFNEKKMVFQILKFNTLLSLWVHVRTADKTLGSLVHDRSMQPPCLKYLIIHECMSKLNDFLA